MKIKKLLVLTIVIVFSLSLSACSFFQAGRFARDDKKIADTRFQKIIEALENKDKESLKKMFSPNALKEANDMDGGIDYIINLYEGKIISKNVAREGSGLNEDDERTSELKCKYTVTTDKDKYIVFFIDQLVDAKNPDNVGLYMLQIIKESDEDNEFDWGFIHKCAGIYRPDDTESKGTK